jgi:predicted transcriptional regulator
MSGKSVENKETLSRKQVSREDSIGETVRKLGRTTRKVLDKFRKEDYIYSVAKDLNLASETVRYHLQEKLLPLNLVERTGEEEDRVYYKITDKGEVILEKVNIPDGR